MMHPFTSLPFLTHKHCKIHLSFVFFVRAIIVILIAKKHMLDKLACDIELSEFVRVCVYMCTCAGVYVDKCVSKQNA